MERKVNLSSLQTTKEVADILDCSIRTVHYMTERKELTPIVMNKRFFMYDLNEVLTLKSKRDERGN